MYLLGLTGNIFIWHSKRQNPYFINLLITIDLSLLGFCAFSIREQFLRAAPSKLASVTKAHTPEVFQNKTGLARAEISCQSRAAKLRLSRLQYKFEEYVTPDASSGIARKARVMKEDGAGVSRFTQTACTVTLRYLRQDERRPSRGGRTGTDDDPIGFDATSPSPVSSERQDAGTSFRLAEPSYHSSSRVPE
jgi:hypothetical protein